jgi:uncharacterized membrane protein
MTRTPAFTFRGMLLAFSGDMADAGEIPGNPSSPEVQATLERRRRGRANRAIAAVRAQHESARSGFEAAADLLSDHAGSPAFLFAHFIWFAVWLIWNGGVAGIEPFDPYPFGLLTTIVSLEAIVMATLVLVAQKRDARVAELREELMLQVNLRMEEEVTKTLQLVSGLYPRLGQVMAEDEELGLMLQPLDVSGIERELVDQIRPRTRRGPGANGAAATLKIVDPEQPEPGGGRSG